MLMITPRRLVRRLAAADLTGAVGGVWGGVVAGGDGGAAGG
jgi:hypothetical protein